MMGLLLLFLHTVGQIFHFKAHELPHSLLSARSSLTSLTSLDSHSQPSHLTKGGPHGEYQERSSFQTSALPALPVPGLFTAQPSLQLLEDFCSICELEALITVLVAITLMALVTSLLRTSSVLPFLVSTFHHFPFSLTSRGPPALA